MIYIAHYNARSAPMASVYDYWVRPDGTLNCEQNATRFETLKQAQDRLKLIREELERNGNIWVGDEILERD